MDLKKTDLIIYPLIHTLIHENTKYAETSVNT